MQVKIGTAFFLVSTVVAATATAQSTSPNPTVPTRQSAVARAAATLAAPQPTSPITFSEFPLGTRITSQYVSRGLRFGGTTPFITQDGANPTSPVLSGSPIFVGAITGSFVDPTTGNAAIVESFSFDAGYFDNFGSTRVQWFDAKGKVLGQRLNSRLGIENLNVTGGNIASWRIETVADEPAGFAVDNVSYVPLGASILFREKIDTDKEGTWGIAGDEIPGFDHSAFQIGNVVYESHPAYPAGLYRSADGNETAAISEVFGVQAQHTKATFAHDSTKASTTVVAFEEIPIATELAEKMKTAIEGKRGSPFQRIDYSIDGLSATLAPAVQKGGGGAFTCVGLVEWAAEQAGHNGGQGFIRNSFESISVPDLRDPLNIKMLLIPLLSPQLLNYSMKGQNYLASAKQWIQGLFDPVEFVIRDPIGRRIGSSAALGTVREMPNAFYNGPGGIQQFLVPSAVPGEYTITMTGLNAKVLAGYASLESSQSYSGFLNKGQVVVKQFRVQQTAGSAGDVNGDGIVNGSDIALLQTRLNRFTDGLGDPGDLDGDGFLGTTDVALLTRLVKTINSGPADVNQDSLVDCKDFTLVRQSLWKRTGQAGFNADLDLVADGVIDARDLAFVSQRLKAGTVCR